MSVRTTRKTRKSRRPGPAAKLQAEAPDLAGLVDEKRLTLPEAEAASLQRARIRLERERRNAGPQPGDIWLRNNLPVPETTEDEIIYLLYVLAHSRNLAATAGLLMQPSAVTSPRHAAPDPAQPRHASPAAPSLAAPPRALPFLPSGAVPRHPEPRPALASRAPGTPAPLGGYTTSAARLVSPARGMPPAALSSTAPRARRHPAPGRRRPAPPGCSRAPIRSRSLPRFRMPRRERAVELGGGECGDAQVTGSGACAPPRPRPQIAGALR